MHLSENTILKGGTYRIIRFIANGGFGCTYEAKHVMLDKRVAIKEFFVKDYCNRDELSSQIVLGTQSKRALVEKMRRKFVDEARALSNMEHDGIVKVRDVFEENGTAYFVMDYIDGCTMSELISRRGKLSEKEAVGYILQSCKALKYVHDSMRLHLDIKPGNIMITRSGKVVLIDFGASKQYDEVEGENTSSLMGMTPGFAPPEQMGHDVVKFTPATDIYSLGATLYKAVTGKTPPSATSRLSGDDIENIPDSISAATRNAIEASMQLNKKKRPQSIAEFVSMLNETIEDGEDETDLVERIEIKPRKSRKWVYVLAAVLLACLSSVFIFGGKKEKPQYTGKQIELKIGNENRQYTYTGPYSEESGLPEGIGEGKYETGTYRGNYVAGLREGEGEFVYNDGSQKLKGTFKKDVLPSGTCEILENGKVTTTYEGTFDEKFQPLNGYWKYSNGETVKVENGASKY
ncbi:MAG: protein kinase [Muribaculaceae bacterium]